MYSFFKWPIQAMCGDAVLAKLLAKLLAKFIDKITQECSRVWLITHEEQRGGFRNLNLEWTVVGGVISTSILEDYHYLCPV